MKNDFDLIPLLDYIDPQALTYQEWINVGMALKYEGCAVEEWERWSALDGARYHAGECAEKWQSFNGSASPVTGATIVQMAKDNGWSPRRTDEPLEWDGVIGVKYKVVDNAWLEGTELNIPDKWEPEKQLIKYLETLFEASETVGYVTESWEKEGKYLPTKGVYTRTAGELIEALSRCNGDIGAVIGDSKSEAGAWIRFNPLDGKGVKNENVTEYRYALIESDTADLAKQNQILHELELPIACLVYSGGKSIHAIVRTDAADYAEYRKRVDFLYEVCEKNGLKVDKQNKNPSRLSRMPGVMRGNEKQYLLATNIGKDSFAEWKEWIESVNDNLPDPESIAEVWDNMPSLAPPLIDGVLRQGHKMLLAGPSKAGKSFALIELCISIAEGKPWLGFNCARGKVLYVNLELDRASCLRRFKDVYTALNISPDGLDNIDIWNLRGHCVPMDSLAPKLIRRAVKKNYIAVIIDPIYKVITGDENSADQMAHFCNQFDKVCTELGCAVIYCHHHSKGAQGGKRSMDRASGSGVFARDPDALLDLIELPVTGAVLQQQADNKVCEICENALKRFGKEDEIFPDDLCSDTAMLEICRRELPPVAYARLLEEVEPAAESAKHKTAWRIEGTLREFPKFDPLSLWFEFPVHTTDTDGVLGDIDPDEATKYPRKTKSDTKNKSIDSADKISKNKMQMYNELEIAYSSLEFNQEKIRIGDLEQALHLGRDAVRNRIDNHPNFYRGSGGYVYRKKE